MSELTECEKRERARESLLSGGEVVKKGGGCHNMSWIRFAWWVADKIRAVF